MRTVGRFLVRGTRRAAVTLVGFMLVGVGLAGLVLPVLPGWLLIIAGFAVLSREYSWAHSALAYARRQAAAGGTRLRSWAGRRRPAFEIELVDPSADVLIDLTALQEQEPAEEAKYATGGH